MIATIDDETFKAILRTPDARFAGLPGYDDVPDEVRAA
jgi:hypothetical protein